MAGKTHATRELLFLNVNKGRLVNKKRGLEFTGYEGFFQGIGRTLDTYGGEQKTKIIVQMRDTEPNSNEVAVIWFTEESYFSLGFFGRILNVDIREPFTFGVVPSDREGREKMSFCYLKQNGKTVPKQENIPVPQKRQIGKSKQVLDWSECLAFFDEVIIELESRMQKYGIPNEVRAYLQRRAGGGWGDHEPAQIVEQL